VVSADVSALGTAVAGDAEDPGGRDLVPAIKLRPLESQRLREVELKGDLRYIPIEELWPRIEEILREVEAV
jgi:hypothetical protein